MDALQVSCGMVNNHQDIFMATVGLREWPYKIYAHLVEEEPNGGKGAQWVWCWPVKGCPLVLVLGHHFWPVELILDLLQYVLGYQVVA